MVPYWTDADGTQSATRDIRQITTRVNEKAARCNDPCNSVPLGIILEHVRRLTL
jgi:hypothetical protein